MGACGRAPELRAAPVVARTMAPALLLSVVLGGVLGVAPDAPASSAREPPVAAVPEPLAPAAVDDALEHAPGADRPRAAQGSAAESAVPARLVRQSRTLFGTLVEMMAWTHAPDDDVTAQLTAAFDDIRRMEVLVDENNPRSPVFRINAHAGREPVVVEPELFVILSELQRLGKVTNGAFDLTAAAFSAAWRFDQDVGGPPAAPEGARARSPLPSKSELDKARTVVGLDDLVLDVAGRTARLTQPGARIALRTVARGYALERAAAVLEQQGVRDFVVSAAGDLVVRGKKGDKPWVVGIQDPRATGYFAALPAPQGAVMTTGDYEEFFFDGGTRYHNVIDPRSGLPATLCRGVTAFAPDALSAEAVARAVFVLGAKDGLALAERLKAEVIVVTGDNKVVVSKGLKAVMQVRAPTDGP